MGPGVRAAGWALSSNWTEGMGFIKPFEGIVNKLLALLADLGLGGVVRACGCGSEAATPAEAFPAWIVTIGIIALCFKASP